MQARNTTRAPTDTHIDADRWTSPLVTGLAALLVAQIVAALLLGFGARDLAPVGSQGPLLAFDRDQINRIRIDAPGRGPLTIEKVDGTWRIPELGDFPASDFKVETLLDGITRIEKRLPVATSESAVKRFKVGQDDYERRVTLEGKDGKSDVLYLGDSPGFRRLFVRADGEQSVYEAELSLFDASEKPGDWSDKTYLHLEPEDVVSIELPDAVLERKDGTWSLADAKEGEALDNGAVDDALRKLAVLDYGAVITAKDLPKEQQTEPSLTIRVKLTSGEAREYRLNPPANGEDSILRVSDKPYSFRLPDYTAEGLTAMSRASLLVGSDETPAQEAQHAPVSGRNEATTSRPSDQTTPADDAPPASPQ